MIDQAHVATLMYEDAGREITQSFDNQNTNLSLAVGTLAALLTVLGAGELFRATKHPTTSFPHVTIVSLVVVVAATPLITRFFIRALFAYQNLLRHNAQRQVAFEFLTGEKSWEYLLYWHVLYIENWRSPYPAKKLVKGNLLYGFLWVLGVLVFSIGWSLYSVDDRNARLVACAIIVVIAAAEYITLHNVGYLRTADPSAIAKLNELSRERPEESTGVESTSAGAGRFRNGLRWEAIVRRFR